MLPEICDAWIKAERAGALDDKQKITAHTAYMLMRGFAKVGITALKALYYLCMPIHDPTGIPQKPLSAEEAALFADYQARIRELFDYVNSPRPSTDEIIDDIITRAKEKRHRESINQHEELFDSFKSNLNRKRIYNL